MPKGGCRLRAGSRDQADLRALDEYRRSFRPAYEEVVGKLRQELGVEGTRRPAKTTDLLTDYYNDLSDNPWAEAARLAIELSETEGANNEVVLLEAQSEIELRKTHRRYFATARELAQSAAEEATTASTKVS